MSSETTALRPRVVKLLHDRHARPVENPADPGTPDVCYVEGWIELKHSKSFTSHLEHYTTQQRIWHARQRMAGGTCWFWWQIGNTHVILDAAVAAYSIDRVDYEGLLIIAEAVVEGFNAKELRQCILQKQSACWSPVDARASLKQKLHETLRYLSAAT
jgi:hypothetical protein